MQAIKIIFFLGILDLSDIIGFMIDTIKKHSDFVAHRESPYFNAGPFVAKAAKTLFPGDNRYGIIATKKTLKFAVKRNRAKRLIRAWLQQNQDLLIPELDYIFIVRRDILDTDFELGSKLMGKYIKKLNKIVMDEKDN